MTVLLREAIGERLRRTRTAQDRTLREVSRAAQVSLGYLSEVERGRKEASSELLASICDALDLPLTDLLDGVAGDLRPALVPGAAPALVGAEGPGGGPDGGRPVRSGAGQVLPVGKADLRLAPAAGRVPTRPRPVATAAA